MNNTLLLILSFTMGILIVMQGGINARLGVLLNNSLLATSFAMVISACFTIMAVFATVRQFPSAEQIQQVPSYMWFTGGLLSFVAVSLFYYIIPRVGISTAVTFGLSGQIIFAAIASHFGWFNIPTDPISMKKVVGIVIMISGIAIIKSQ